MGTPPAIDPLPDCPLSADEQEVFLHLDALIGWDGAADHAPRESLRWLAGGIRAWLDDPTAAEALPAWLGLSARVRHAWHIARRNRLLCQAAVLAGGPGALARELRRYHHRAGPSRIEPRNQLHQLLAQAHRLGTTVPRSTKQLRRIVNAQSPQP